MEMKAEKGRKITYTNKAKPEIPRAILREFFSAICLATRAMRITVTVMYMSDTASKPIASAIPLGIPREAIG